MGNRSGHNKGNQNDEADENNEQQGEERLCLICMEGEEEGQLITPCGCKGVSGLQYYHYHCLREWIIRNHDKPCTQCGQKYMDKRIRRRPPRLRDWLLTFAGIAFSSGILIVSIVIILMLLTVERQIHSSLFAPIVRNMRLLYVYLLFGLYSIPFLICISLLVYLAVDCYRFWRSSHSSGFVDFTINLANGRRRVETLDLTFAEFIDNQLERLENERIIMGVLTQQYNQRWDEFLDEVRKTLDETSTTTSSDEEDEYKTADEDSDSDEYMDANDRMIDNDYQVIIETLNKLKDELEILDRERQQIMRIVESDTTTNDQEILATVEHMLRVLEENEEEKRVIRDVIEYMLNELK